MFPASSSTKWRGLSGLLVRRLLNVKYVSIVNILAGREVLPEFLQDDCEPAKIVAEVNALIENDGRRRDIIEAEAAVVRQLAIDGHTPSEHAAAEILRIIGEYQSG